MQYNPLEMSNVSRALTVSTVHSAAHVCLSSAQLQRLTCFRSVRSPQGINVTPALIAVAPVVHSFGKPAVAVNPVGLSVKPPPVPGTTVDGVPVKATPAASSSGSSSGSGSGASTGGGSGAGTGTTATVAGRKMV